MHNLRYLQWTLWAAGAHIAACGWDAAEALRQDTGWVVRSHDVTYRAAAMAGDEITVRTWVSEIAKFASRRKYLVCRPADKTVLARVETRWVYVDLSVRKVVAIPNSVASQLGGLPAAPKSALGVNMRCHTESDNLDESDNDDNRADGDRYILLFLQVVGGISLLAFLAAVMPEHWMVETAEVLGIDPFPASPLTFYLARNLSLLYGFVGGLLLLISFDLDRYRPLVWYVAVGTILFGVLQLVVDSMSGLPAWWTLGESISTCLRWPAAVLAAAARLEESRRTLRGRYFEHLSGHGSVRTTHN